MKVSYFEALNYTFSLDEQDDVLFVIDTNYFLYTYQSYSQGEVYVEALNKNKDRIYVPFMVYIEFLSNINSVTDKIKKDIKALEFYMDSIVSDVRIFDKESVKENLKSISFNSKITNYKGLTSLLKQDIEKEINTYVEEAVAEVEKMYKEIEIILSDRLRKFAKKEKSLPEIKTYEEKIVILNKKLNDLFESALGTIYSPDDIKNYLIDLELRYSNEIPPGFCDKEKDGYKTFGELIIPNNAGDLVLWKDIVNLLVNDEQKKNKYKKVVIVTEDGMSDQKSDWRIKRGNERVIHDHLKIEFYQKTNKLLDLITVDQFIDYFSGEDKPTIEFMKNEIKSFNQSNTERKIKFSMFNSTYTVSTQYDMMARIFVEVIERYDLIYDQLRNINCISLEIENTTFESYQTLKLNDGTEVLLATRLNKTDKLRYIKKIFEIANVKMNNLVFHNDELQEIWKSLYLKKLNIDEIIVSLESPEEMLGISRISNIECKFNGVEVISNTSKMLNDKLINFEFTDDRSSLKEKDFKSMIEDLGYFVVDSNITFEDV